MFRRRHSGTMDDTGQGTSTGAPGEDADSAGAGPAGPDGQAGPRRAATTPGKGRPTPKRSEAEHRRRQPYTAPRDRKEASQAFRDRQRDMRARRTEAMRRGEEWALPPRDKGPVKALARDYVDSRRRVSEFYMYGLLLLVIMLFIPALQAIVQLLVLAAVVIMLTEGIFLGRRVRRLVEERLPGESTRGIRMYAAMRAIQIRQLRVPKPRIKPGDPF